MDKGKQAVENMKNMKMPKGSAPAAGLLAGALLTGGAAYGLYNSLYNGS